MEEKTTRIENGVAVERTVEHSPNPPSRTGACPWCLAKHLRKVRGYIRELNEDPTRSWEREKLLENLGLAEDHAAALGDAGMVARLRKLRLAYEPAEAPDNGAILGEIEREASMSNRLGGGGGRDVEKEPAGGPSEENAKTLESRQVASVNTDPTEG